MRERVKGGELLSDAFAAQGMFPKMYTTTLMAGEKSGNMEEVLSRYIQYQRMVQTFRKKLLVSLVYPALLISVVTVMLIFLITYRGAEVCRSVQQPGRDSCRPSPSSCWQSDLNAQKYAWIVVIVLAVAGTIAVALEA